MVTRLAFGERVSVWQERHDRSEVNAAAIPRWAAIAGSTLGGNRCRASSRTDRLTVVLQMLASPRRSSLPMGAGLLTRSQNAGGNRGQLGKYWAGGTRLCAIILRILGFSGGAAALTSQGSQVQSLPRPPFSPRRSATRRLRGEPRAADPGRCGSPDPRGGARRCSPRRR